MSAGTTSSLLRDVLQLSNDVELPFAEKARRYYEILNAEITKIEAAMTALTVFLISYMYPSGETRWRNSFPQSYQ